jgi:hypothetical protein
VQSSEFAGFVFFVVDLPGFVPGCARGR